MLKNKILSIVSLITITTSTYITTEEANNMIDTKIDDFKVDVVSWIHVVNETTRKRIDQLKIELKDKLV